MLNEARDSCLDCVRKHLAQAEVLMNEAKQGYPANRWRAIGHLGEAGDECCQDYPKLSAAIRAERVKYMADPDYQVPIMELIEKATALVQEGETEPGDPTHGTAWTLAVDALADGGVSHGRRGCLADRVIGTLRDARPSFVRSDLTEAKKLTSKQRAVLQMIADDPDGEIMVGPGTSGVPISVADALARRGFLKYQSGDVRMVHGQPRRFAYFQITEKGGAALTESRADHYTRMAGDDWKVAAQKAAKKLKRRPLKTLRKRDK